MSMTTWFEGLRARRPAAPRAAAAPPMGRYLMDNDIPGNGHVRDRKTNKVLVMVAGMSLLIAVVEGVAIAELIPLYKVVPFMVQFSDKADQVVTITPPSGRIPGIAILVEANVRDYIKMRNVITADTNETISRWGGPVRLMSSDQVYGVFLAETKPVYDDIRAGNFTRSIEIRSVLQTNPGYFQVEFTTFDHKQGTGLTDAADNKATWIAQMRVDLEPKRVTNDNRALNPLGFTVVEYSVARKRG